jgi:NAD(P)-dependent dehydrogenase (short-subunit alcohol dehydrogenase family)
MIESLYNLENKIIVITGGGSGLGLKMAEYFVAAKAKVVITGRREQVLKNAVHKLGLNAVYFVNDVTSIKSLPELVSSIKSEYGTIDTLINNSGINLKKHILDTSDEEFERIIQTNLSGVYTLSREVARIMKKKRQGSIIMIASMAALYGIPNVSAYTATKSALLGLTRALAVDLSPFGIRVNAVSPGFIDTPMLHKAFHSDPEREKRVLERTPMNRLGTPDDVAMAVLFLASDASRFITGINLPVDGGNSIGF